MADTGPVVPSGGVLAGLAVAITATGTAIAAVIAALRENRKAALPQTPTAAEIADAIVRAQRELDGTPKPRKRAPAKKTTTTRRRT